MGPQHIEICCILFCDFYDGLCAASTMFVLYASVAMNDKWKFFCKYAYNCILLQQLTSLIQQCNSRDISVSWVHMVRPSYIVNNVFKIMHAIYKCFGGSFLRQERYIFWTMCRQTSIAKQKLFLHAAFGFVTFVCQPLHLHKTILRTVLQQRDLDSVTVLKQLNHKIFYSYCWIQFANYQTQTRYISEHSRY